MTTQTITRALISVYDKSGVLDLAAALDAAGVQILSTGSTARIIADSGVKVTPVEHVTGFPECFDGRVKTLHPKIHGGLLADRRNDSHLQQMSELDIAGIDMLVVNLYPFVETVASGASFDECVEQIDIGGPAMLRAAAKNHANVAVITSPQQYGDVAEAVSAGGFTDEQRRSFAQLAFAHTATYDAAVASWLSMAGDEHPDVRLFPQWMGFTALRQDFLRYGENPHQKAALYSMGTGGFGDAELLHGKPMSYNNYVDADAAVRAAYEHGDAPCCAVIKHANPCGIAVGETIADAHAKAHACDPLSAFGGIIATNREVDADMARSVAGIFTEVIVAPAFSDEALSILQAKANLRLVRMPSPAFEQIQIRPILGGLVAQERDTLNASVSGGGDAVAAWTLAAGEPADDATLADLQFAWRACRSVKSNAILLARDGACVGIGMGQVNRVDSCRLAVARAGSDRACGAVAASDAFFPFADGLVELTAAGVRAVVAPGGSKRDEEVIAAAREAGVTLYFTGVRHFAH